MDAAALYDVEMEDEEENYNSASDEDFNPTTAAEADDQNSSESSEDDEPAAPAKKTTKRKRKVQFEPEFDSGDEATIKKALQRRKKKQNGKATSDDDEDIFISDDEGGEGGLIKTRAQRRVQVEERRPLARIDGAKIDVDAIWASLVAEPVGRPSIYNKSATGPADGSTATQKTGVSAATSIIANLNGDGPATATTQATNILLPDEEYITIKRTYKFAGEVHTEEKQVPKSSAEAKLYLSTLNAAGKTAVSPSGEDLTGPTQPEKPAVRRPLKRSSRFEPNPQGLVTGLPSFQQLSWPRKDLSGLEGQENEGENVVVGAGAGQPGKGGNKFVPPRVQKAQKLNTVDKSRYDWAGFVDKEGIADELDEHGRAKEGYLGRMDFLGRVEARREEGRRDARAKGVTG